MEPIDIENEKATLYFKLFVYITLFTICVLSTTIILHESGHFMMGSVMGCKGEIILFDAQFLGPHTDLECPDNNNLTLLFLSSFLLVIPFALFFLILRGFPESYFSLIIIGMAIFTAALDIQMLIGLEIIRDITVILGIAITLIGQYLLTDRTFKRFKKNIY
ncbi:MAG: hypothetical protein ABIJ92_03445 [Candidatus Aenigmatarchaeota archaeon]